MPALTDTAPVILDAARTPFGRRDGWLAPVHAAELLGHAQGGVLRRLGVDPATVDQVIGGCVTPVGEQYGHVTRTAWLHAGLPHQTGATTIDAQCGTAAQATLLLAGQIAMGAVDVGVACGVELMSRVPLTPKVGTGRGTPRPEGWSLPTPDQYVAADRIARARGLTRSDLDAFGQRSQQRARAAWDAGHLTEQVLPIDVVDGGSTTTVSRDQGLRDADLDVLAGLPPTRPDGLHTAATSSQVSDGASAAVLASVAAARDLGLAPRARILAQCVVGGDLELMLDASVHGAQVLLDRLGMGMADIDVVEVNEAFAAVPLSFARVHGVEEDRLNPGGGAIALGHPAGATGIRLIATALGELGRRDGTLAMVAICASASTTCLVLERL